MKHPPAFSKPVGAPFAGAVDGGRRSRRLHLTASLVVALLAIVGVASPAFAVPAIPNPSFEANAPFANAPGSIVGNAPIVGWTANQTGLVGLNPAGGQNFHADPPPTPHPILLHPAARVT